MCARLLPKPNIIICESYQGSQEAFRLLLGDWTTVHFVDRAENCIPQLTHHPVELFILDLNLQQFNPIEYLRNLRAKYPCLKVLLVAGQFE